MAIHKCTSPVFSILNSSSSSFKERACSNFISFPYNYGSYRFIPSRRSCPSQATVSRDNVEKVVTEDSFQANSFPDEGKESLGEDLDSASSSVMETWMVKFEQSFNVFLTESVIKMFDALYHDRDFPKFFVLETIARVPYFAFICVLHMYESFGWWRRADYLKVHFAEAWNEMHHLLIMEELGGNAWWFDRFLAHNIAGLYYFMTAFMYLLSPRMAYHLSECVENHAFTTYDKFIKDQEDLFFILTMLEHSYLDEFQTSRAPHSRRPKIENLYDVFINIRDDEAEHCKTMKACQIHATIRSPHSSVRDLPQADCEGIIDCIRKSFTSNQKHK